MAAAQVEEEGVENGSVKRISGILHNPVGSTEDGIYYPGGRRSSRVTLSLDGDNEDDRYSMTTVDDQEDQKLHDADFERIHVHHHLTEREKEIISSFDSFDYFPSNSSLYRDWLRKQPSRLDWDRWIMMGIIGVVVGIVYFLLHQVIHLIVEIKWHHAEHLFHGDLMTAWLFVVGYSMGFVALGAASVAFICLPAGGSGIPEVIGFLNGTVMRHVFTLRAFCVKFFSCCCAVGAGMPVGPEGPMIHIGSIVGAGFSQFRSQSLKITLPFFARFRNSEDRRNFTTAGAAAGVAAAFGAPVGGLLFAMEEVSSFWSMKLGWMIFFCCMVATFTGDIFNAAFHSFHFTGVFGLFNTDKFIIFKIGDTIPVNVLMFIPAVILGIMGGLFGSLFNFLNVKCNALRGNLMRKIPSPTAQKVLRFVEPLLIMLIWGSITVFLPTAFPCKPTHCPANITDPYAEFYESHSSFDDHHAVEDDHGGHGGHDAAPVVFYPSSNSTLDHCVGKDDHFLIDDMVKRFWCKAPHDVNGTRVSGEYNEAASLLNVDGQGALRLLFSRQTHYQFSYASLCTAFPLYFILSCWAAGSAVSSGLVVPMLYMGALYGRAVGRAVVDIYGGVPDDKFWSWIDPGALSLVGAASFFGGVSRLTMSLTVIMIEITNDVNFLLPILVAVMVAKWIGDLFTHPLYHALLELKCIPFLDNEPIVYNDHKKLMNLDLYQARDIMNHPAETIKPRDNVAHLAELLLDTCYGGFPVTRWHDDTMQEVAYGFMSRTELSVILMSEKIQEAKEKGITIAPEISYDQISVERVSEPEALERVLQMYVTEELFKRVYVDLTPYINRSAPTIKEDFSLLRTFVFFRTMGLRTIAVVDPANRIVGIISRKDLMTVNLGQKLQVEGRRRSGYSMQGDVQKLLEKMAKEGTIPS